MQVLTHDDARIDVCVDGDGGDAVVLIHGFPLSNEIWKSQVRALSPAHRVVAPDLRGMGRSDVTAGPYLMESLAGDVAAVLDAIGIERATVVGHSLGGYVAMAFARMYAERVERLALVCSRLAADAPDRARWRFEMAQRVEAAGAIEEVLDAMLPGLIAPQRASSDAQFVERVRKIAEKNAPNGLAAMLRGMALRDAATDIAPDIDVPVLVIAGACDASLSQGEAAETVAAFPRAELVVCPESGHLPMLEEPEAVDRALVRFMRG